MPLSIYVFILLGKDGLGSVMIVGSFAGQEDIEAFRRRLKGAGYECLGVVLVGIGGMPGG